MSGPRCASSTSAACLSSPLWVGAPSGGLFLQLAGGPRPQAPHFPGEKAASPHRGPTGPGAPPLHLSVRCSVARGPPRTRLCSRPGSRGRWTRLMTWVGFECGRGPCGGRGQGAAQRWPASRPSLLLCWASTRPVGLTSSGTAGRAVVAVPPAVPSAGAGGNFGPTWWRRFKFNQEHGLWKSLLVL